METNNFTSRRPYKNCSKLCELRNESISGLCDLFRYVMPRIIVILEINRFCKYQYIVLNLFAKKKSLNFQLFDHEINNHAITSMQSDDNLNNIINHFFLGAKWNLRF